MFSYVFSDNKWIETEKLYPHDIALFMDPKEKRIYLWEGPRATTQIKENAEPFVEDLKEKFPQFTYEKLQKVIPQNVQNEIDKKLDLSYEITKKIDRNPAYKTFLYLCYLSFIVLAAAYFFILGPLRWETSIDIQRIYIINKFDFADWVSYSKIAILIVSIFFGAIFISAIFTKKIFLIATGLFSLLIEIGTYIYISLGVFLFAFQSGAPTNYYYISRNDVLLYIFLNILALIAILIPLIISIFSIRRNTKPISFKEWWNKWKISRTKKIRGKKLSVVERKAVLIPLDKRPENIKESKSEKYVENKTKDLE